ncbi:hypothetical protein LguiA_003356 [Lonicera macranthoides]
MVSEDQYNIAVPSFFRCPISLDLMKSPVSLCTGVTYDRSSIQRWLDGGNNTCPATMQVLTSKDFVPNHTLQRLIQIWSDSVRTRSKTESDTSNTESNSITQEQARELVQHVKNSTLIPNGESLLRSLTKLNLFALESDQNRKLLASSDGFLQFLFVILGKQTENVCLQEKIIELCGLILEEFAERVVLVKSVLHIDFMASMLILLQKGSLESRISSVRVLDLLAVDTESRIFIAEHEGVLLQLLRIVSSSPNPDAIEAALSCLIRISIPKRIRSRIVQLGSVKLLGKILSDSDPSVNIIEKIMKLLEMVSSVKEGRTAICEDENCVQAIVKKLLKVSSVATEHAVTILWSLCCLFRNQIAQESVTKSNGLAKFLLLMQSDCSPAVRQMAGDLLKIFRVNSKCCLSSYDTKTTHIMPF